MPPIIKKVIAVFTLLVLVNVGFAWYGQASFEATLKTLGKAFVENNATATENDNLPDTIEKYLAATRADRSDYTTLALQFDGDYYKKPSKAMQMHALALLRPTPDMLWGIRLSSNPIVTFNAIETYHTGRATMQMLLFGIIPTGELEGERFARSELARVLAYAVFNPRLLPCGCISYESIDATHTKATIRDGNISASVTFISDENGRIVEIQSSDRARPLKRELLPTQWRMAIRSYGDYDGLLLPKEVQEDWIVDGRAIPCSRYTLTSAERL
ncbi:DUF6544 family protein [Hydrogenimonas cancrithermarum]|uniref:Uncharacterized protein n=1 Tax=Hydrogenimonas cancrithermarum TaxID=2993563 RepID=A0ABM8FLB8_9BACT|nr:DUF6544 family protein [Hydrogenimonas cancrithermarum]BDY13143.1 hypothetical protein HCR_14550 [Hydrogenimonas cancrithermarum]